MVGPSFNATIIEAIPNTNMTIEIHNGKTMVEVKSGQNGMISITDSPMVILPPIEPMIIIQNIAPDAQII